MPALMILLLFLAFLLPPASTPRAAPTDVVTNCNATGPGSLPDLLTHAPMGDLITFALDCPDAGQQRPIRLNFITTVSVTIDATMPLHTVVITGGLLSRMFTVNSGVTLGLRGLTLENGLGGGSGGGAIVNAGTLNVEACTFTNNAANNVGSGQGGAILNTGGTVNVVNGTFSGNAARNGNGGAIASSSGTVNIVGSTFSGNSAQNGNGGAIANSSGNMLSLTLSAVAGNTGVTGPDILGAVTTDGGSNVVGDAAGSTGLTAPSDKLNTDPLLGPLASNGGTVQTFALLSGSPAIDIAACPTNPFTGAPLATDARGVSRPQGARCDAGSYELLPGAQTFLVTRAADDVNNANCNSAANGGCTLRQAVNASNAMGGIGTNTIIFAIDAPASAPITLTAASGGFLAPTANVTIDATTPLHNVTIRGGGGGGGIRLFDVRGGITLGLRGLTLANGGGIVIGGAVAGGGAIANIGGTVNVANSTFSGNFAEGLGGGAIFNGTSNGGSTGTGGTLNIMNSTFSGNSTITALPSQGGAIFNESGTVTVVGSTFFGNSSSIGGGAISNDGMLTVVNSTFSGNTTRFIGGAISNGNGPLTVVGSTFSGNAVTDANGASGALSSGNLAMLRLALSTVAGNTAPFNPDIGATVTTDGGGNVVGDIGNTTGLTAPSDRLGTAAAPLNPLLAPLALYAPGTVQTVALLPGSPAIDRAACPGDPTTNATLVADARGIARPQLITCDAGAFESRGFTTSALTGNMQSAPVNAAFASPVGLTVSSAFNEPVAGGQITYTIVASGGASATFSAAGGCALTSATVAVCPIDATGIATGPAFTANGVAGAFTIVATATGIVTPTTFTETNTAITPAPITTTTALTSSLNPSTVGQSITFTASVSGAGGPPTGTVTFKEDATILGTGTLSSGTATFATSALAAGSHPITAVYSGDATFAASTSNTVTQVVNAKGTTLVRITITGPNSTPPPTTIKVGQSVPITATGTYSSSPPQDLTTQVQWSSTNPTIAKVDPAGSATAGRVTGESPGTVTLNGVTQSFMVTVVAPTPIGITVQPAPASRPGGASDPGAGLPAPAASPAGR